MRNYKMRIESVEIHNFKNIEYGFLSFENSRNNYNASILGIYGQNGSGKTALIDAIAVLQYALRGQALPSSLAEYIHLEADFSKLVFTFKLENRKTKANYKATYEFCMRKEQDFFRTNTDLTNNMLQKTEKNKVIIFNEILSCSYECDEIKQRFQPIIDTSTDDVFVPKTKYEQLIGTEKKLFTELIVAKTLTAQTSRSFIFSRELLTTVRNKYDNEPQKDIYYFMLESLTSFGNFDLFVINTANSGLISMQALPVFFKIDAGDKVTAGNLALPLEEAITYPKDAVDIVEKVISDMNIVLPQIVPGLKIGLENLGTEVLPDGSTGIRVQLISNKNIETIPFKNESEGIKKLVSILHLLIAVYNDDSITVAVDELDAGIFEYLLGELLRIISENGKGQLIFTSHNLRPLETLDKGFIAFTTTNPKNRYIRFNNVKTNHNLRDFYYRDIVLGEQKECVYETTNNAEIAFAFREAGVSNGT